MLELIKLLLKLFTLIFPFIFKEGIPYDEGIKKLNELIDKTKNDFSRMDENERTIALSNLVDDFNRVLELRK